MTDIIKMDTQFKYIGTDSNIFTEDYWYVTEFPSNMNGEMMYVLDVHTNTGWGDDNLCFTGLFSIVVTRQELEENFEIVGCFSDSK